MSFLSPEKILVVLVVALVVLGPERLPKLAHDIGKYWSEFQKFRQRLESEVRASMPNLPATSTITSAVRSPISFLDGLAASSNEKAHADGDSVEFSTAPDPGDPATHLPPVPIATAGSVRPVGPKMARRTWDDYGAVPDDPSLN